MRTLSLLFSLLPYFLAAQVLDPSPNVLPPVNASATQLLTPPSCWLILTLRAALLWIRNKPMPHNPNWAMRA